MAKKPEIPEERKPDLAAPDQDVVEQRVKKMLDISESEAQQEKEVEEKAEPKPIEVAKAEPEVISEASSAPVLPEDTKSNEEVTKAEKPVEIAEDEPAEKVVNLDEAPKDEAIISIDPEEDSVETEEVLEIEKTDTKDSDEEKIPDVDPVITDEETSQAVDDIIAKESDALLEAEDEKLGKAFESKTKKGIAESIKGFFSAWWNNPKARWITIFVLLASIVTIFAIPTSRYYVLNSVGVRGTASITVIDESTGQPLKNVNVKIVGASAKTDSSGVAEVKEVKLGKQTLTIEKRAFAPQQESITVKLGKNTLPQVRLKPTGVQYAFVVNDYLSGKPVDKAEASSGEATALSDGDGKIKLTIDASDDDKPFEVTMKKEGYRDEKVAMTSDIKTEQIINIVPSRKHAFVSKRSGKYDVFSIDVDGKNEKLLLAGTGSEKDDIALAIQPNNDVIALVSTRDSKTNKDGFLLSTLTIIQPESGEASSVTTSERVQVVDWIGDNLIYVQATEGASATNPKRHRLMSYNYKTKQNNELASSNYFNDVVAAGDKIYYAPSSAYQKNGAELYRVNSDGGNKTTILNQEVWNIFRIDYDNLALSVGKSWYNVRIGEDKATVLPSQPSNLVSRIYVDANDKKNSLWVDNRDGKGVLLNYKIDTKDEQTLRSQSGLKNPIRWLNNKDVIYRVSNDQETADYVLSLDGGEPKKIIDVTNTNSIDKWYYY
jgi:hypothetical protein